MCRVEDASLTSNSSLLTRKGLTRREMLLVFLLLPSLYSFTSIRFVFWGCFYLAVVLLFARIGHSFFDASFQLLRAQFIDVHILYHRRVPPGFKIWSLCQPHGFYVCPFMISIPFFFSFFFFFCVEGMGFFALRTIATFFMVLGLFGCVCWKHQFADRLGSSYKNVCNESPCFLVFLFWFIERRCFIWLAILVV